MADSCLLIGDLGGTNARFALAEPNGMGYSHELTLACSDYETAELAIANYLESIDSPGPDAICLAAAGPVIDNNVRFINNHWNINGAELGQRFSCPSARLLNDFEAIAYSIPALGDDDLETIGSQPANIRNKRDFTIAVLGSGTGLGEAGLISRDGVSYPVVGEGSHSGFGPETPLQMQVLQQVGKWFGRVSDERLLSGPGLENIYRAICRIEGGRDTELSAADIFQRSLAGQDVNASETLALFYEVLGQVAGNLALTLGAWDGVYVAGGIVKRYPDLIKSSKFRSGFENKGRYQSIMQSVPTMLIMHPQPGLLGASFCARQM